MRRGNLRSYLVGKLLCPSPVFDRQKLLLALIIHADYHQRSQLDLLVAQTAVNAIHLQVHPSLLAKISHYPLNTLCLTLGFQSRRHFSGRSIDYLSQQHSKHLAQFAATFRYSHGKSPSSVRVFRTYDGLAKSQTPHSTIAPRICHRFT